MLSIMLDVASLMLNTKYHKHAVELLQIVTEHPASNAQHHQRVESRLPDLDFSAKEAPPPEFETMVAILQAELEDIALNATALREQPLADPLTPRELEILHLLTEGLTNPAIAEELVISVGTVKSHTSRIYSKLGVSNRTEAAMKARQLSLIGRRASSESD
jgi:DNA-binding NarL/FixJ family response regulator